MRLRRQEYSRNNTNPEHQVPFSLIISIVPGNVASERATFGGILKAPLLPFWTVVRIGWLLEADCCTHLHPMGYFFYNHNLMPALSQEIRTAKTGNAGTDDDESKGDSLSMRTVHDGDRGRFSVVNLAQCREA